MATLKDIAGRAGVSVAAASAALSGRNGTIGVSAVTREKVTRIADELGYRPNRAAASLRTGRTGCIGLYLPRATDYLAHPRGALRFSSMCQLASSHGFQISILMPGGQCDARTMDGCLVMDEVAPKEQEMLKQLAAKIPVVSMSGEIPKSIPIVSDLSWQQRRLDAATYLYERGHRHVAVVHLAQGSQSRVPAQFQQAADSLGVRVQIDAYGEADLDRAHPSIDHLLANLCTVTAIFTIDDEYARALISRLAHVGRRVPEDISVFSGSTSTDSNASWPALTGLRLDDNQAFTDLFSQFVAVIKEESKATKLTFPPLSVQLIERESCIPILPELPGA